MYGIMLTISKLAQKSLNGKMLPSYSVPTLTNLLAGI
jgi:hypothetical protein